MEQPSLIAGSRAIVVDECHALSKATWQSLLKATEEPSAQVLWIFCTTEPDKVPPTIKTRCTCYDLKPLPWELIADRLVMVVGHEALDVEEAIVEAIARKANGSLRQALVYLEQVQGITGKKDALKLLETVAEEGEVIELARLICDGRGFTWERAMVLVNALQDESPESIRIVIVRYASAALLNKKGFNQPLLAVLDAFKGPYNPSEAWAPLLLSIGQLFMV